MKHFSTLLFALWSCFFALDALAQSRILMVSRDDNTLRIADSSSLVIISNVTMSASGVTITGATGLDVHPCTGVAYVMLKISGQSGRSLATVDTLGNVNILGNTGDNFASIAFDASGTLYGVTGDGANTPETLYTLNLSTGAPTLFQSLGNGDDGECIAYNPDDGFLYHWSGLSSPVFEKIDLSNGNVTNIPFLNPNVSLEEVYAALYLGNNQFGTANIDDSLHVISTTGFAVSTGVELSFTCKGFAVEGDYPALTLLTGNEVCPGDTAVIEAYNGTAYQWYKDGVLLSGETNQQLNVTTGGHYNCIVTQTACTDSLATGIAITELNLPVVSVSPSGTVGMCDGDTVTLTGSGGGTSQWYRNGQPLSGETSNTIEVTIPGLYNMTKTNLNGCTDSASAGTSVYLLPDPAPAITGDSGFCPGDSAMLQSSQAFTAYSWSNGDDGQTTHVTTSGTVTLEVTDTNGCTATASVTVVNYPEPLPLLGPDTVICHLASYTLDPGSFASYDWSSASNDSELLIDQDFFDTVPDSETVFVTVTNAFGCAGVDSVEVGIDICGGIAETGSGFRIGVYPNPASEVFTLSGEQVLESVTVMDIQGRTVYSATDPIPSQIDVRDWEPGVYFMEATAGGRHSFQRVVVE